MAEKLYSVFKEKGSKMANDLVFSQKGYVKRRIHFKNLRLLIIHLPERSYHFILHYKYFYVYHEGDEFTQFLKTNEVPCAEYHLTGLEQTTPGKYDKLNGGTMSIEIEWVRTGWNYSVVDHDKEQETLEFHLSKAHKIRFDHEHAVVEFVTQGDLKSPEIKEAMKDVKISRFADRVSAFIMFILALLGFFLLGKIWTWIFGEPEDLFNLLLPQSIDMF